MKAYIASRILNEEDAEVLWADGDDGELWVFLYPVWDEQDGWDLLWETDCPEAVCLRDIYEHFRRREMSVEEWGRELRSGVGHVRGHEAEQEFTPPLASCEGTRVPSADKAMLRVGEVAALLTCSYGEARKRMLEGRIRAVKDGRWLRTRLEWVEEYLASRTIKPVEGPGTIHELPVPSRRKTCARVKPNGIGYRFLRDRAK
jgi:excisionase family DNA binding protein